MNGDDSYSRQQNDGISPERDLKAFVILHRETEGFVDFRALTS